MTNNKPIRLGRDTIDNAINQIYCKLLRYGTRDADRLIDPLLYYINTGRANAEFLYKLINTKPYMIARRLDKANPTRCGSYDDSIDAIKAYLNTVTC